MTIRVQIILGIVLVVGLIAILRMVKKRDLELKYVLAWILCDVILVILTLRPSSMQKLAEMLGIYSPTNMIFFLGFIFSILIIFSLTVALSRVTARVRKLAQTIALMEQNQENCKKCNDFAVNKQE